MTQRIAKIKCPHCGKPLSVRDARHALMWNQQELADKMNLSRCSIANIETGRQRVLLSDLFDFAKVLRLEPKKLFAAVCN